MASTARDRLNFIEMERDEGLEPHKVLTVYIAGSTDPTFRVDISATLETKIEALKEHRSQIPDAEAMAARVRERALDPSAPPHFTRYAEHFKVIQLR